MTDFTFNFKPMRTRELSGSFFFNADDYCVAVGYTSISGVTYHVTPRIEADGTRWITLNQLSRLAEKSGPRKFLAKAFLKVAQAWHREAVEEQKTKAAETVTVKDKTLYTLAEVAKYVGTGVNELQEWLVAQGHCGRYANGNLKLNKPFRDSGYATKPIAESGKESNVIRLTVAGKEYIKNRLISARDASVLSFAKNTVNEEAKLEAELDTLIQNTFKDFTYDAGTTVWVDIKSTDLNKKIKAILAQVKLKKV